jgi:hypothetical protein
LLMPVDMPSIQRPYIGMRERSVRVMPKEVSVVALVAGLGYHGRRHEQDVMVTAEPRGAFCMVFVPAIGQRIQDVSVNDDHEFSRLPAEALSQQLIGPLRHIGPPAVTDPSERRQGARCPAIRELAGKRLEQSQGT